MFRLEQERLSSGVHGVLQEVGASLFHAEDLIRGCDLEIGRLGLGVC